MRTWTARQWSAFERTHDRLTRTTMPAIDRRDPRPKPQTDNRDRVDVRPVAENDLGRLYSF